MKRSFLILVVPAIVGLASANDKILSNVFGGDGKKKDGSAEIVKKAPKLFEVGGKAIDSKEVDTIFLSFKEELERKKREEAEKKRKEEERRRREREAREAAKQAVESAKEEKKPFYGFSSIQEALAANGMKGDGRDHLRHPRGTGVRNHPSVQSKKAQEEERRRMALYKAKQIKLRVAGRFQKGEKVTLVTNLGLLEKGSKIIPTGEIVKEITDSKIVTNLRTIEY
jgi:hypothetical protein